MRRNCHWQVIKVGGGKKQESSEKGKKTEKQTRGNYET